MCGESLGASGSAGNAVDAVARLQLRALPLVFIGAPDELRRAARQAASIVLDGSDEEDELNVAPRRTVELRAAARASLPPLAEPSRARGQPSGSAPRGAVVGPGDDRRSAIDVDADVDAPPLATLLPTSAHLHFARLLAPSAGSAGPPAFAFWPNRMAARGHAAPGAGSCGRVRLVAPYGYALERKDTGLLLLELPFEDVAEVAYVE